MAYEPRTVAGTGPRRFDGLLAELSTTLVECPPDAIAAHVDAALGGVADLLDFDRAWLAESAPDGALVPRSPGWARMGYSPLEPFEPGVSLPWITARLGDGAQVCVTSLDELPPEAAADRAFLKHAGIRSLVSLPLVVAGVTVGWLAFATTRGGRPAPSHTVEALGRLATTVAGSLARAQGEAAVRRATDFERVVAELAARLMRVSFDAIDSRIVETLGSVGMMLGADRASILQLAPEQMLSRTHLWARPGTPAPAILDPQEAFPWITGRLFEARELVVLARLEDLPPEAAVDRASLERYSVASCALAPMVVADRVVGIISFATVTHKSHWSPDLLARLRLVVGVIGSALARRDTERSLRSALEDNERLRERLEAENVYLKTELGEARDFGEIVGRSAPLHATLEKVRQVADTDAPVLLLGETGTGKELLARSLHAHGPRRGRPFIAVNCAALPATLIESELFGHEKGAFTGATQAKPGRFELADRGTLLLDEIGDLEPSLQTKLLRILESGELQRLGATVTRKVDVRIIAATNRDLRRDMREGRFRSDLYYRVGVFPILVPPLRDRREDVPLLVWHFIQSRNRTLNRAITKIPRAVMAALQAYEWPGNVRELQNVIERAMILSRGSVLRVDEALGLGAGTAEEPSRRARAESLEDVERDHILHVLDRCRWTIEGRGQAAERLGLNPSTLRNRMRKLGITRPRP